MDGGVPQLQEQIAAHVRERPGHAPSCQAPPGRLTIVGFVDGRLPLGGEGL